MVDPSAAFVAEEQVERLRAAAEEERKAKEAERIAEIDRMYVCASWQHPIARQLLDTGHSQRELRIISAEWVST